MRPFERLEAELDEWNFAGEEAVFWWRDDDAVAATRALERLSALAQEFDVPLALAVIPDLLEPGLRQLLDDCTGIAVIQHGIRHVNNAADGCKKQELVYDAPDLEANLGAGFTKLAEKISEHFYPVLVPPWNRIDSGLFPLLEGIGFRGLSCFTPREAATVSDNVWMVNTHVDIIDWKGGRQFVGEQKAIEQMVNHLCGKRLGEFDRAEPTGLLTHHLVHDDATWMFLKRLLDLLDQHPAVTWLPVDRVFQTRWR